MRLRIKPRHLPGILGIGPVNVSISAKLQSKFVLAIDSVVHTVLLADTEHFIAARAEFLYDALLAIIAD